MTFQHPLRVGATFRTLAIAAAVCGVLAGCAAPSSSTGAAGLLNTQSAVSVAAASLAPSLYEVADVGNGRLYAASAGASRRDGKPGQLFVLDPATLAVKQTIEMARKPFALAHSRATGTLYVGNTYESYLTAVDAATGQSRGELSLDYTDPKGNRVRSRQVVVDEKTETVYVGGVVADGIVWVVDGRTLTLKTILKTGRAPGLALHPVTGHVYTSGTAGWTATDPATGRATHVEVKPASEKSEKKRYLINLAFDEKGERLFATDSAYGELLVFNAATGEQLARVDVGSGALGVRYDNARKLIYVSSRGAGTVKVIDAANYAVLRTVDLVGFPNSLAQSADGKSLFVTLKQPFDKAHPGYRADGVESVVRISLP